MKTDSLFYRLFQSAPEVFFQLIEETPESADLYTFRSVELKQTAFRVDGVFLPTQESRESPVYFVEVQFQKDEQLYRRLFAEIFLYLRQNEAVSHWKAVVVYPSQREEPEQIEPYRVLLESPQVQRIYLNELGPIEALPVEVGLVRLIVEPEAEAMDQAQGLLRRLGEQRTARLSQAAIIELVETIIVYKFPQMSRQEIEAMLGISELKQTRVYQEALEEGRQEGRGEGRIEGERSLILRLLARKLGELPEAVSNESDLSLRERIETLSIEQLEALGEALLEFDSLMDLTKWLERVQSRDANC